MKTTQAAAQKLMSRPALLKMIKIWQMLDKKVVLTNGVFDILHEGHIASLNEAASHGDILIVALNNDASVKRLKGEGRPVNNEAARALLLASLLMTDAVILFEEDTPLHLINEVMPAVLVKGGDYTVEQIAGAKEVLAAGGKVVLANMVEGISTTKILAAGKALQ